MSWSRPTTPQRSSSAPAFRAYARIAASTARQWRRNDSDSTHSVRRFQASSRESCSDMAVTLAAPAAMEKFVIDGGVPLSGTIVPAGNKNGALPILAACLLTEDEMVLRNVPRISDVEAMLALLETLGAAVDWISPSEIRIR